MSDIDTYLASLPQDMKVSDISAKMLFGAGGSSLEAAMPVAKAPERKRSWGGKPVDTRTFQQYDPSNPVAQRQITTALESNPITAPMYEMAKGFDPVEAVRAFTPGEDKFQKETRQKILQNMSPENMAMMGTFAGVKAKNAPLGMLEKAKQMAAEGVPDKQIWAETGWTKGFADKQWRWEIPDNEAYYGAGKARALAKEVLQGYYDEAVHGKHLRMIMDEQGVNVGEAKRIFKADYGREPVPTAGQLAKSMNVDELQQLENKWLDRVKSPEWSVAQSKLMEHPDLYKAYPHLEGMPVHVVEGENLYNKGFGGEFAGDKIRLNADISQGMQTGKSVNLHELQHAVQEREGFARGGSPESFVYDEGFGNPDYIKQAVKDATESSSTLIKLGKQGITDLEGLKKYYYANKENLNVNQRTAIFDAMAQRQSGTPWEDIIKMYEDDLDKAVTKRIELESGIPYYKAQRMYESLAGEAEARLTANRMNLTPEERRMRYPVEQMASDVPVEQQIVRGVPGAVEQAYAKMRDPKSKALLERQYPELKESKSTVPKLQERAEEIFTSKPLGPKGAVLYEQEYAGTTGNRRHVTMNQNGWVQIGEAENLAGVMGETRSKTDTGFGNYSQERWDKLLADIQKNGLKEPIFITVDYGGKPKISEGNHRVQALKQLGYKWIPAEIRYFGNAQQSTILSPEGKFVNKW